MATFKAVVYKHHKKDDGTYNIKIRITHQRQKRHIATIHYITKDDLTKGFKIKNQSIIDTLDGQIKKYRKACDELGEQIKDLSADKLLSYLDNYKGKNEIFQLDFIKYGRDVVKVLQKTGHTGNAKTYDIMLNVLEKFCPNGVDVSEISAKFVERFVKYIEERPEKPNRKKGDRAVSLYLANLRALHNMAKAEYNDEDNGVINIPLSPFTKIKVPKPPSTRKRALSVEQIQAIAILPYTTIIQDGYNRFNFAKDIFLLSFGLIGMNTVDLFNCDCMENGRITYNRTKTKNRREDQAEISIRIEPEIIPLIEKYRDKTGKRVFNFYQHYANPDTFNTAVNKGLKKIGKLDAIKVDDLEFYAARHSWATIAINRVKVNKYVVHSSLNHVSDEEMKVTDIYIEKDYSQMDEANRKVLDFMKLEIGSVTEPKNEKKPATNKRKQGSKNAILTSNPPPIFT